MGRDHGPFGHLVDLPFGRIPHAKIGQRCRQPNLAVKRHQVEEFFIGAFFGRPLHQQRPGDLVAVDRVHGVARLDDTAGERVRQRQTAVLEAEPAHQHRRLDHGLQFRGDLLALAGRHRRRSVLTDGAVTAIGNGDRRQQRPCTEGRHACPGEATICLELLRDGIADAGEKEGYRRLGNQRGIDEHEIRIGLHPVDGDHDVVVVIHGDRRTGGGIVGGDGGHREDRLFDQDGERLRGIERLAAADPDDEADIAAAELLLKSGDCRPGDLAFQRQAEGLEPLRLAKPAKLFSEHRHDVGVADDHRVGAIVPRTRAELVERAGPLHVTPGTAEDAECGDSHHTPSRMAVMKRGMSTAYLLSRYSCEPHSKKLSASPILTSGFWMPAS